MFCMPAEYLIGSGKCNSLTPERGDGELRREPDSVNFCRLLYEYFISLLYILITPTGTNPMSFREIPVFVSFGSPYCSACFTLESILGIVEKDNVQVFFIHRFSCSDIFVYVHCITSLFRYSRSIIRTPCESFNPLRRKRFIGVLFLLKIDL